MKKQQIVHLESNFNGIEGMTPRTACGMEITRVEFFTLNPDVYNCLRCKASIKELEDNKAWHKALETCAGKKVFPAPLPNIDKQ